MIEVQDEDRLFATFFKEQPQPAFWMIPVWNKDQQVIIDFEYVYCNNEFYTYTGLSKEKVLGNRLFNSPAISVNDYRRRFYAQLTEVYQTGKRIQDKFYNPDLDKYYSFTRNRVQGGVLTVLQDRTEEYLMLKQLEEQTAFTNNILKHSSSGIVVTEIVRNAAGEVVDGKILLVNKAAEKFLNIPKEAMLQQTIAQSNPSLLDSPLYQMSIKTLETGEPFQTQYGYEPSGKWIELSVSKMDDNHLIAIFTDVSGAKAAQLQLMQAAERLQAVFDTSQSGMFTFAPVWDENQTLVDFRFVITNPTFAAYVGQTPDVLQGALGSTWFPGYLHNGVFEMYKQTFITGEAQRRDVHYEVDGHDLYLDLLSTKVGDEVLVAFTDYTALKTSQYQLEKLVEDLKRSNTNLGEFAHAASHDLKEPIRKISTFLSRLSSSLDGRMNEMETGLFERMQKAAERMYLLVDDLLSYSVVSTLPLQMETVDLNEKLKQVLFDLEVHIEETNAVITIEELPVVKGYKRQLQQLFQNLVSNAVKYRKAGVSPAITIRAQRVSGADVPAALAGIQADATYHQIEVKDNGIGFDQVYAERIFGMFQRLHGKSEYPGTGIGLAIARKVIENHKGFIWAEGKPGEGATFFVLLPVQD